MNSLDEIKDGEKYYTCLASMESDNYSEWGRAEIVKPYQAIAKRHVNPGGIGIYLHRFNRMVIDEDGFDDQMVIDEDSNATALVNDPKTVFLTAEEALRYYRQEMQAYADRLIERGQAIYKDLLK